MKTLGILGGMGPLAGAYFYERVIANTPAVRDCGHIPVILLGVPQIPDRTAHIIGDGESPLAALVEGMARLVQGGAEVIAVACNTAHAYLPALRQSVTVPILDMPRECLRRVADDRVHKVGLLSTSGTRYAAVYERAAENLAINVLYPSDQSALSLDGLIYRQKQGECLSATDYEPHVRELYDRGAEAIVLGCTEISLAFGGNAHNGIYDALEVLAIRAVNTCFGTIGEECENGIFQASAC